MGARGRTDGHWVEVYDGRALVDRNAATTINLAGAYRDGLRIHTGTPVGGFPTIGLELHSTPTRASFAAANPAALAVYGSYLFMVPNSGTMMVLDVADPLTPKMIGTLPFGRTATSCYTPGGPDALSRVSLKIAGVRAYISDQDGGRVIELE